MLHEQPRLALGPAAGEVCGCRQFLEVPRILGNQVVVVGDHIHLLGPAPVVHGLVQAHVEPHEVGGHGMSRVRADDRGLGLVAFEQLIGGVAGEVQLLGRVHPGPGGARRQDLLPGRVALGPEGGAPRGIEGLQAAVPAFEPAPETRGGTVREIRLVVAAVLVVDMPHHDGGVVLVPGGDLLGQGRGGPAVFGTRRREGLPGTVAVPHAVGGHGQGVGVLVAEPGRRRRRGVRQVHPDAVGVQQVQDPVQPAELVDALGRLKQGPAEDAHADQVDAGLAHQPDVLVPGLLGPLFRVVVSAECQHRGAFGAEAGGDVIHGVVVVGAVVHVYPLLEPRVRPATKWRCRSR
ncbi:hypothetical protein SRABI128_06355 [Microbacterium sp. Bi128]|nr:hypothetical protein SRABI128_06355 [Microbacterium sp. Bi128]